MTFDRQISKFSDKYFDSIVKGDQQLAHSIIGQAIDDHIGISQIYTEILTPAQIKLGDIWHAGDINIAQEHFATSITIEIMERLRNETKPRNNLGVNAVLAVLDDERHIVGMRMLADLLIMDGWTVDVLTDPTPISDLIEFTKTRQIDLLGLSFTLDGTQTKARIIADALLEQGISTKILLGGRALGNQDSDLAELGFIGIAKDAVEGLKEARVLLGLQNEKTDLGNRLVEIGMQIKTIRTQLKITQQELANRSELDRTYISMVENGKQNLTFGAMVKIADALEVSLTTLVRY
tara:strand:- start:73 stop:951 length:879 start_codon:yes stop_codon:yes gene_type:complete